MEEKKYSIIAKNISKGYKMYSSSKQKLLDLLLPKGAGKTFYALKDISFKVKKGEVVGLLGLNGSGKSTLSNILGGVSMPTSGEIEINGEASLIAIGIGMNNFLTGIENIELKALMMGYKKAEIEEIKQEIIDFADIGEFINQPLRTYSSGMRSRLGFAISIYTNPDILVIDEALSVGDPTFTQKCLDKMNEFKESGKTIFFVSHALPQIKQFCNKAMWLEYGTLKEYGDVDEVLPKYQEYINKINKMTDKERLEHKKSVLKNQDHSLLKEFKLVDKNFKKFVPTGKFIKKVSLVNDKNMVKNAFYNIDISTFAFGFIPSLLRKRYETAIFVLIAQILNFFIISFPFSVLTNFIVTGIASIFTAKGYLNYLVEEKRFIPYTIWKKINDEDKNIRKQIAINNRKSQRLIIFSILFALVTSLASAGYIYMDTTGNMIAASDIQMKINNYAIVTYKNEKVQSILILNSKEKNELNGIIYPGNLQVQAYDKVDELTNLIDINSIGDIKNIIKTNFNIQISNYVLVNKDDIKDSDSLDDINVYENILLNLLKLDKDQLDDRVKEIENKYQNQNIDQASIKDFYDDFKNKNINISNVKYDVVLLGDLVEDGVLKALNLTDKENYKFITTNKRILKNNVLVKNINEQYSEYLENQKEEEIEEPIWIDESNSEDLNSGESGGAGDTTTTVPPSNSGSTGDSTTTPPSNSGGSTEPPSNSGGTGGNTEPPTNSGGTGGNTEPPTDSGGTGDSTEPPSNNEGTGDSTEPPTDSEGTGDSTEPPSNGEGTGDSTKPPTDSGETGGSTEPPVNNGESEVEIPLSDNGGTEDSTSSPTDKDSIRYEDN
ncbi:teichoic acids export ABC transporter ATP-binding subunit TagH [Clostridium sp. AL.422]|uniref:teichoic acids export ABC transporter ATP-binding subunit TagH n=1 Tax=Clostridium TaxID=1485 RepID=UPI00293DD7C3|nr:MULTISPECIES: teichoic acids export ABC transporter ATP-binding subunit TagH [unclassified Clostridium]MDV4150274.1 teichoic acids export ABC transporter ATP-binding subunit TagH [Clostridium sp. AL.422]